jgi:hypothetical protein
VLLNFFRSYFCWYLRVKSGKFVISAILANFVPLHYCRVVKKFF